MREFDKRMKEYENVSNHRLVKKQPVILWLDGRAFHTFTKGLMKPFDDMVIQTMRETAKKLCENIQNAKLAYTQSDEIAIVLTDLDNPETHAWFDYRVQKMASVAAAMATLYFNQIWNEKCMIAEIEWSHFIKDSKGAVISEKPLQDSLNFQHDMEIRQKKFLSAMFDCRVFNLPNLEVENWLIWRQQDWMRNSVQMLARSIFSQKKLQGCNNRKMREMITRRYKFGTEGVDKIPIAPWEDLLPHLKYGTIIARQFTNDNTCVYTGDELENGERKEWRFIEPTFKFAENRDLIRGIIGVE